MRLPMTEIQDIVKKLQNWEDHVPDIPVSANMPLDELHKFEALYKELGTCNSALHTFVDVHAHARHLQPKFEKELHDVIRQFFNGPHSQDLVQRANTISGAFYQNPTMFADRLHEFEKLINQINAA